MADDAPLALVTGATGFIATHVIAALFDNGQYRVRGTVRNMAQEGGPNKALKEAFPELQLVEADLSKDEGWKEAVEGCTFVHHLASPFPPGSPPDPEELIRPAVDGTKRVLQACADSGTVKRVVLTSSISAISNGMTGNAGRPSDYVYTADDWTDADLDSCVPYEKSKTLAEKAAWDFIEKCEESKKFELVVINPSAVFGPLILPRSSTSHGLILFLLARALSGVPDVAVPFVDVRDVAKAHVTAMTNEKAPGNRYILWNNTVWLKELSQILGEEFISQGYNVPQDHMSKLRLWFSKFFNPLARFLYSVCGLKVVFDNSKMKDDLGIEPVSLRDCVLDSAYSLIEKGIMEKKPGYKGKLAGKQDGEEEK